MCSSRVVSSTSARYNPGGMIVLFGRVDISVGKSVYNTERRLVSLESITRTVNSSLVHSGADYESAQCCDMLSTISVSVSERVCVRACACVCA